MIRDISASDAIFVNKPVRLARVPETWSLRTLHILGHHQNTSMGTLVLEGHLDLFLQDNPLQKLHEIPGPRVSKGVQRVPA